MEICLANASKSIFDLPLSKLDETLISPPFPMAFQRNPINPSLFCSPLSNNSILLFSLFEAAISIDYYIPLAHEKRINEIFISESVLYSCSNDSSVKLWDLNTNKSIKTFRKNPEEIFTIAKSKHILAGGCSGKILFWDLRMMKERSAFSDSHDNDVTKLEFHPEYSTLLLSGSMDGILCLFDLAKENEEEAVECMIREKQPIDSCGFANSKDWAFTMSTTGSISMVNLPESTVCFSVNVIENVDLLSNKNSNISWKNENNQCYLIDCERENTNKKLSYYRGNQNGFVEEFLLQQNPRSTHKVMLSEGKYVRCIKRAGDGVKIVGTEDGVISLVRGEELNSIEEEAVLKEEDVFMEEEKHEPENKKKKKFKSESSFKYDPLRK